MSDADTFVALWRFRKAMEEEVHPLLEKLSYRHDFLFTVAWKRTHAGRKPRMELVVSWPRQTRGKAHGGL